MDQVPRRKSFRSDRRSTPSRPQNYGSHGQRPSGDPRHAAANARTNYERYTAMAKDAARRGEIIEAENFYQHAEHYFRVMREQGS